MIRKVLAGILVAAALTACGGAPPALQDVPGGVGGGPEVAETTRSLAVADPTMITIPAIGAKSDKMMKLGLLEGDKLQSPPIDEPGTAGWYAGRDPEFDGDEFKPGQNGPAVIAGHVDGLGPDGQKGFPGVFKRLPELNIGDEVLIERDGQPTLTFEVTGVEKHPKAALPWSEIMAPTQGPELRLITCGGAFNQSTGHYVDNWVVSAKLKV